jgi:hypothetical protein
VAKTNLEPFAARILHQPSAVAHLWLAINKTA